jgi:HEPN domain-containing protein
MRKDTQNWLALADYDLETARLMLASGRYLYVIFLCHLALEKSLKAHVSEATKAFPPKTHDLIALIKFSGLSLPQDDLEFVGKVNAVSIPTRYPDDLQRTIRAYPEPVARAYLEKTEAVIQWLGDQFDRS